MLWSEGSHKNEWRGHIQSIRANKKQWAGAQGPSRGFGVKRSPNQQENPKRLSLPALGADYRRIGYSLAPFLLFINKTCQFTPSLTLTLSPLQLEFPFANLTCHHGDPLPIQLQELFSLHFSWTQLTLWQCELILMFECVPVSMSHPSCGKPQLLNRGLHFRP